MLQNACSASLIVLNLVNQTMSEKRFCAECQEALKGRKDQKFCGDYCRNSYNNRLNEDANAKVRRINRILRKNRRIMLQLMELKKSTLHVTDLAELGFNFHYYTNIYTTQKGSVYTFCYDYGYLKLRDDAYRLIEKMDFVN